MLSAVRNFAFAIISVAVSFSFVLSDRAHAQTYQIDCAILLCLAGGWPASEPCARARAEFIRRITPWPVEPPLQIWRCPMGASYTPGSDQIPSVRFYDIYAGRSGTPLPYSSPEAIAADSLDAVPAVLRTFPASPEVSQGFALQLVQDRADIDISGPEFNFVRSIRVFDVLINDDRDDGDCDRYARVRLGSYGTQGDFSWQRSNRSAIPTAFGPTRSGCSLFARAVFVEWRDYLGNYGYERINY